MAFLAAWTTSSPVGCFSAKSAHNGVQTLLTENLQIDRSEVLLQRIVTSELEQTPNALIVVQTVNVPMHKETDDWKTKRH